MPFKLHPNARHAVTAVAAFLLVFGVSAVHAGELPKPTGPVILTITGSIANTNAGDRAEFDRAMLEALGVHTLTTTTNWTDGPQMFDGVRASQLLEAVGTAGTIAKATALNDYSVAIPLSDFLDYPVLLALRANGVELTARDKGPIWLVYPRDDYRELRDPRNDLKWIWQLTTIDIQ